MTNVVQDQKTPESLKAADLQMDVVAHSVRRGKVEVHLNRKEFALLEYLMRNQDVLLTRQMILEHVWDTEVDELSNTVDVHMSFLRRKIDEGRRKPLIRTVHGCGYKMTVEA